MIENCASTPISRVGRDLDTVITLQIYGDQNEKILNQSFDLIAGYENRLIVNRGHSGVMDVNHAAGLHPIQVSASTYNLIKLAAYESRQSFGFNALIEPAIKLQHIGFKRAHVPTDVQIKAKMSLTNPDDVVLDDTNRTVLLTKKGMELDLGGITKGYTADRIRGLRRVYGVRAGIVDLGSDVLLMNSSPKRASGEWISGVQDPKKKCGSNLTTVTAHECLAVTGGTYEYFLEVNGKRYHHIIDSKTGHPVQIHIAGVTLSTRGSVRTEIECKRLFFAGGPIPGWKSDKAGRYGAIFVCDNDLIERISV